MKQLCASACHGQGYRHNCLVVYKRRLRDLWRKSFWVVCSYCDQLQGPHRTKGDAWKAADAINDITDRWFDALALRVTGRTVRHVLRGETWQHVPRGKASNE